MAACDLELPRWLFTWPKLRLLGSYARRRALAMVQDPQGHAFDKAFERHHKSKCAEQSAENPQSQVERRATEQDRAAARDFQNGARPAAFFFGKLCDPRHVARVSATCRLSSAARVPSLGLDPADVAREFDQAADALCPFGASRAASLASRMSNRPVLRAALTTERPTRAGAPAPTMA